MNDATFNAKLSSILTDNKFDRWVSGKRTGKIDTKRLYKIKDAGTIFKKKQARKGRDYNIMLVIDTSGSMRGPKIETAIKSTIKLHHHFEKLGIRHKIVGFDTFIHVVKDWDDKPIKKEDVFWERLWSDEDQYVIDAHHEVYHQSDSKYRELTKGLGEIEEWSTMRSNNVDGFAINQARLELARQKGSNIMIVLSDGQPCMSYELENTYVFGSKQGSVKRKKYRDFSLRHEVHEAIKSKITFLSVGIEDQSVFDYYPKQNTIVIRNVRELYSAITSKLSKLITRG